MRKMFVCMLAAGVLGVAVPAFASDNDRDDRGGIDVGPLGQCFDPIPPTDCRVNGRGAFAYGYAYGFAPTDRFRPYRPYRR